MAIRQTLRHTPPVSDDRERVGAAHHAAQSARQQRTRRRRDARPHTQLATHEVKNPRAQGESAQLTNTTTTNNNKNTYIEKSKIRIRCILIVN